MSYLYSIRQVTEMVVLDFWKGLFECLCYTESIFVQLFLESYFSSMILKLTRKSSLLFFESFFITLNWKLFSINKISH